MNRPTQLMVALGVGVVGVVLIVIGGIPALTPQLSPIRWIVVAVGVIALVVGVAGAIVARRRS